MWLLNQFLQKGEYFSTLYKLSTIITTFVLDKQRLVGIRPRPEALTDLCQLSLLFRNKQILIHQQEATDKMHS